MLNTNRVCANVKCGKILKERQSKYCSRDCFVARRSTIIKICKKFLPNDEPSIDKAMQIILGLRKRYGSYQKAAMFLSVCPKTVHKIKKDYDNTRRS